MFTAPDYVNNWINGVLLGIMGIFAAETVAYVTCQWDWQLRRVCLAGCCRCMRARRALRPEPSTNTPLLCLNTPE